MFLAPEQRYTQRNCRQTHPVSTVQSDVWKIPLLAKKVLKDPFDEQISSHIMNIASNCQILNPEKRWNTSRVLTAYQNVLNKV